MEVAGPVCIRSASFSLAVMPVLPRGMCSCSSPTSYSDIGELVSNRSLTDRLVLPQAMHSTTQGVGEPAKGPRVYMYERKHLFTGASLWKEENM